MELQELTEQEMVEIEGGTSIGTKGSLKKSGGIL